MRPNELTSMRGLIAPRASGAPSPWRGRASGRLVRVVVLMLLACGASALRADAAARVGIVGWPLARAEAEALAAPALRAPRDSSALAASSEALARRLQDAGWLDARVHLAWNAGADSGLVAQVAAGERYRWSALAIEAPPEDSAAFAASWPAWPPGGFVSPGELSRAITRAVDRAEAEGYAWAWLGVSAWDADSGRVRARLGGARGPRVTIGEVRLNGLLVTRADVAERAMGHLRERPYDPAAARAATLRLEQLGIFRRVEYLGLGGTGDWSRAVLSWRVEEPRYTTFEGAVGVQGGGGAVGLARVELGNLLGTARSVSLSWQSRGRGLADFGVRYVEPMLFGRALRWEGALQQQVQDTSFTRFRYGARAKVALGLLDHAEAGFDEERVVQPHADVRDADAQNTTFALEHDGRDDARTPRHGARLRLEATQIFTRQTLRAPAGQPATLRNTRGGAVQAEGEWHRAIGRGSGVALETRAADRFSTERVLGDWERFPVGGAASLRGHDEEAFRVDRYVLARLEWRWFLGAPGQRLALFWDHAEMRTRVALAAGGDAVRQQGADGVGVGLRLPAAGGDVDLDYGLQPGHGFLEGKIHLRLVTAF